MKTAITLVAFLTAGATALPQPISLTAKGGNAAPSFSCSAALSCAGKFVPRGRVVNTRPVIHPSVALRHESGVGLSIWGVVETTDEYDSAGKFTEVDYTLDYRSRVGVTDAEFGLIHYQFPNTAIPRTTELYGLATWGGPWAPSLGVFWDVDRDRGVYACAGACHRVALGGDAGQALSLSARLGFGSPAYNRAHFGASQAVDRWALNDLTVTARLPIALGRGVSVTPSITAGFLLDGALRSAYGTSENLFPALEVSAEF